MPLARLLFGCFCLVSGLLGYAQEHRPGILYSTYLGGSGNERGDAIAIDREGNVYVAGVTSSTDFPTTEGAFLRSVDPNLKCNDFLSVCPNAIFVTKLSPDGQKIIWSTYLHQGFSERLQVHDLQVSAAGELYISGMTDDFRGFPTTPGSLERSCPGYDIRITPVCAFVAKLSSNGSQLIFSSFFGAQILGMTIRKLRLDDAEHVILAGDTLSDIAFVAKLDPQFTTVLFIQRLGGTQGEQVSALEVDGSGIYVGAGTRSADFPATPGALKLRLTGEYDGFVTKLSHNGDVIFSTLIGGSGFDAVTALWVEPDGAVLVGGRTESSDFPVSASAYQARFGGGRDDAFVALISGDGSRLLFSTFLGGAGDPDLTLGEVVRGVARASDGSVQVIGSSRAPDFPLKNGARLKPTDQCRWRDGCAGIFLSSLNGAATELLASTIIGGPQNDDLHGMTYRGKGWWATGQTSEFPITPDAFQASNASAARAFVVQLYAGPQDFTINVGDESLDLTSGSATTTLLLAAVPAFADEVTLSCQDMPANYSCRFSPSKVFLGAGKKQVVLAIDRNPSLTALSLLLAPFGLALGLRRRLPSKRGALFVFVLFAVSLFAGCRGIRQPESENQTTTVKIVAQSQTVSHSTSLQLSTDPR